MNVFPETVYISPETGASTKQTTSERHERSRLEGRNIPLVTLVGTGTDVAVAVFVLFSSLLQRTMLPASHIQDLRHRNKERAMDV